MLTVLLLTAHPRSRGENPAEGTPDAVKARLIPAHAGKTRSAIDGSRAPRAHPRSRGENFGHFMLGC